MYDPDRVLYILKNSGVPEKFHRPIMSFMWDTFETDDIPNKLEDLMGYLEPIFSEEVE
jgi:hypothetical protein